MLNNKITNTALIGDMEVVLSSGVMAKQANGSIVLQCGNTVMLATATMSKKPKEGIDFFPLTVEYAEKSYSAGKIPGGFFKRESRPSTNATLTARLIDRPIRPLFPKGMHFEVQVVVTVLSYDPAFPPEALAINAASAALMVSNIPFSGPVGSVLVGYIDGKFVVNPSHAQLEKSDLHIVVAGTKDAILMVEAGAQEVSEEVVLNSILVAHEHIKQCITLQEGLAAKVAPTKLQLPEAP